MHELVATVLVTSLISSVVGAVVGAVVSKIKVARMHSDQAREDAADMREMLKQNTLMTCRIAIYDEHFSTDEKLDAYKEYRKRGGNHQTKTYMDSLVGGDVDEYIARHSI